jgi:CRP/FNR family transcriptional regulator, anaerobic regulatory protein
MKQVDQSKIPLKIKCTECPLRLLEYFREFSQQELDFMVSFKMGELTVEPGTGILKEKTNSPHLYTVLQGWCFRYRTLADGSRQLLNFALPGDMIGLQSSMFGEVDHSVDALTNLTLCVFSRERIWELFQHHPSLAFDVTWLATREERILGEYLTAVGQRTAQSRLAFVLMQLYRRCEPINLAGSNRMPVPFTQQHLADLIGLSLVHTNKTLRRLTDRGYLSWQKGMIRFLKPEALAEIAELEEGPARGRPFI